MEYYVADKGRSRGELALIGGIIGFCALFFGFSPFFFAPSPAHAGGVRIKDITDFEGARANQLYGFGLVIGLNATGSKSASTQQMAIDMMKKLEVNTKIVADVQADGVFKSNSISAVMVTAEIGPFARKGSRIDVTVSTLDDASSLQGGTLLLTPLKGVDGQVYAVCQGPISIGGFLASGQGATVQKNHPTVGRIPNGAIIEHEALGEIVHQGQIRLLLRQPDYGSARSIAKVVNEAISGGAKAIDAGTVQITVPSDRAANVVTFASELGMLEIIPDAPARVVIIERTGTIVAGENVQISSVAVAHGALSIVTSENPQVVQPAPFSPGTTTIVPQTDLSVTENGGGLKVVKRSVTVAELAKGLNALGATPRDLISILQAMKEAGALHAELTIQ